MTALPAGVKVFERGWLSANNILLAGPAGTALVDSGYCAHATQTLALVGASLGERPLDLLINTHLHSDHCGGNLALQRRYTAIETWIPPGQAEHVRHWDPVALTYSPTGQECPEFRMDAVLLPGTEVLLGERSWQIHGAPGHDPHSVILFEPQSRTLISADALWENGFGVVFPELEGQSAFDEVGTTLDVIEALRPALVIPGHGSVFADARAALTAARRRLESFVRDPRRHAAHAAKVLLKFKLLDQQRMELGVMKAWVAGTRYFGIVHDRWFADVPLADWTGELASDLVRSGAARIEGGHLVNI